MPYTSQFGEPEPTRSAVDAMCDSLVIEFGAPWCPHCQGAQPLIEAALKAHPQVRHIKVEDGKGLALGRSFKVKLWPTLIFMRGGHEVARLVRPTDRQSIVDAMAQIT